MQNKISLATKYVTFFATDFFYNNDTGKWSDNNVLVLLLGDTVFKTQYPVILTAFFTTWGYERLAGRGCRKMCSQIRRKWSIDL